MASLYDPSGWLLGMDSSNQHYMQAAQLLFWWLLQTMIVGVVHVLYFYDNIIIFLSIKFNNWELTIDEEMHDLAVIQHLYSVPHDAWWSVLHTQSLSL